MRPVGLLLLTPLVCLGQTESYSVRAEFEKGRSVDRILDRVAAEDDRWIGEQDFEAVDAELKKVAAAIKEGDRSLLALKPTLDLFSEITLAEFKVVGSRRRAGARGPEFDIRLELGGHASDGRLLSLLGPMKMVWGQVGGSWRPLETAMGQLRESSADDYAFTEITDEVFGGIDSFNRQLALGVDHWRGTLDAALGLSVYGHQGISVGDANGDGVDDLYISEPSGLPNRLYLGDGRGSFVDATARSGLGVLDETSMSLFADVDEDGDEDLILIAAEPLLFRNDGKGEFAHDPDAGLSGGAAMFTGAALADYDLDGDLDLYVCSYDFWTNATQYQAPTPYYDARNGPPNFLFRNRGDGTFEDVTEAAGLRQNNDRFSFAPAWGDYDNDGDPDLYVANDFGRNNLYRNNSDGTFTDVAASAGVEDLAAGMSAAWGDYDNDGDLDLYVGNMWSSAGQRLTFNAQFAEHAAADSLAKFQRQARGNSLFVNNGDGTFHDAGDSAGVTMGRWAWASDFVDLNNDGLLDLFVQNGYITGERLDDL